MGATTDLLGRPTTEVEDELLELYRRAKALLARDDLPLRPGRGPGGHRRPLERRQRPRPGARAAARPGRLTMPVSERHSKLVYDALVAAGVEVVSALPETWLVHLIRLAEDDPEMILVRLAKEEEGSGCRPGPTWPGASRPC